MPNLFLQMKKDICSFVAKYDFVHFKGKNDTSSAKQADQTSKKNAVYK